MKQLKLYWPAFRIWILWTSILLWGWRRDIWVVWRIAWWISIEHLKRKKEIFDNWSKKNLKKTINKRKIQKDCATYKRRHHSSILWRRMHCWSSTHLAAHTTRSMSHWWNRSYWRSWRCRDTHAVWPATTAWSRVWPLVTHMLWWHGLGVWGCLGAVHATASVLLLACGRTRLWWLL